MANNVPITNGQGQSSVAAEEIGTVKYQQIKVMDGTAAGTTGMKVNPDGSISASIIGTINTSGSVVAIITGTPSISGAVTVVGTPSISGTVNIGVIPGSVVAFQGTTPWIIGSIYGNISGSVVATLSGVPSISGAVTVVGTPSISGTVNIGDIKQSVFGASVIGHAPVVIVGGSITTSATANQSVSGTVLVQGTQAANAAATANPVQIGGKNVDGSVVTGRFARDGDFVTNVHASVISFVDNVSNQIGTPIASDDSTFVVTPTFGYVFDGTTWDRTRGDATNGTLTQTGNASVITINQAQSIVGTYTEDASASTGDKGIFVLGVRNDTLSSLTSADLDYSASAVGPVGESITANAPITKWVRGTADLRVVLGASVTAIPAQGASIFTYITAVQVANMGSASVLVTLGGGLGSILGYTIAPAGGGSNIYYPNALKTGENSAFTASISGTASVLVSAQGFISKV